MAASTALGQLLTIVLLCLTMMATPVRPQPPPPTPRQLCEPGAQPPSNRFNSTERLRLLRNKMTSELGVQWYLETGLNRMLSAPQPSEKYRVWISGFTGSSGQVLVTDSAAYLFTDTRYTLQADQELDCHWQLYDTLSLSAWVAAYNDTTDVKLAVDARQIRAASYQSLINPRVTLVPLSKNPVDELWTTDRPEPVAQEIYPLGLKYTGKTWQAKVGQARESMGKTGADFLVVAGLDETAHLLNLRATVLAYVPYFPSLVLISSSSVHIFLDNPGGVLGNETLRKHLSLTADGSCESGVELCPSLHPLTNVTGVAAQELRNGSRVWLDTASCSYAVLAAFRVNSTVLLARESPVKLAKAVKNAAERDAFTSCSLADSAALVAFLSRLQNVVRSGEPVTELSAGDLLATYRAKVADFRGLSFETIAASGPNAAVIHYRPSAATNRAVGGTDVFLLDSGGQFLGCTTDVTRTMYYGVEEPPAEVRDAYTRVLMGVIDLFNLTWPSHLHSRNVDPFARHNLWAVGRDYRHGTGHGIGLFLGVHEGPNGIGRDLALVEGNFQSIEPGFYQGAAPGVRGFGIRLETITGVKLTGSYLRFQPVTWVPFERRLINAQMLSVDQLRWLNWYHTECQKRLPGALKDIGEEANAASWLSAATAPIVHDGVKAAWGLRASLRVQLLAALAASAWLLMSAAASL